MTLYSCDVAVLYFRLVIKLQNLRSRSTTISDKKNFSHETICEQWDTIKNVRTI